MTDRIEKSPSLDTCLFGMRERLGWEIFGNSLPSEIASVGAIAANVEIERLDLRSA